MDAEGYYARLGVPPDADASAITAAYRARARVLHPDVPGTGNAGAFILLHEAYEVLGDALSRARYDRYSRDPSPQKPPPWAAPPPQPDPAESDPPWAVHPQGRRSRTDPRDEDPLASEPLGANPRGADPPEADPSPPPLPQIPAWFMSRGARLGLVGGLIVLTVVSVGELTTRIIAMVQAPPPAGVSDLYEPPKPAAPLETTGTPTHYVLPTGGSAPLWRYDAEQHRYLPATHLEPFSGVAVLDTPPRDGMVQVQVAEGQGFIDATRLAPGDATVARRAYCGYNAGPPLKAGEVLSRHGNGAAALRIDNTTAEPVILKLRDAHGTTAVAVEAEQGVTTVTGLTPGRYTAEYATGTLWSRACGNFIAGERTWRLNQPVLLPGATPGGARLTVPTQAATEIAPETFPDD